MTKIEIKSIFGSVLFTHECENNTIKTTLEEAVKHNAYLYNANLENANLENANLKNANLKNAYLKNANLYSANLENANLENAYLKNANLYNANLYNANLYNANLENANLENANLYNANLYNANLPVFCRWSVSYSFDFKRIKIGCKEKTIDEWDNWFNSSEEYSTKRGTDDFKRIFANYCAVKAYFIEMTK